MKILVVDNDSDVRDILEILLTGLKYTVTLAEDGKVAKSLIENNQYDVILSDIQMPFCTGIELLEWAVNKKVQTPIILMTGFAHIFETKAALEKGASGFLTKPFSEKDLVRMIKHITEKQAPESSYLEKDDSYLKVPIKDFISTPTLEFDLYIKLSDHKYLKIAPAGDTLYRSRIIHYKQKGLHHLYVLKTDFNKVVGFNILAHKFVQKNNQLSSDKKLKFLRYSSEVVLEKAFVVGTDQEAFNQAKDILETSFEVISDAPHALDLLDILNNATDYLYAHSLGVSIYSVLIADKLGWCSHQNKLKLSVSGLFHDIGKKEIPTEVLQKPRALLSISDVELIESHPRRGMEILESLKIFPPDIVNIVYEHHENCMGTGFPRRLMKNKIHPLARVLSLANIFCSYTIQNPHHPQLTAPQAIDHIEKIHGLEVDPEVLVALKLSIG